MKKKIIIKVNNISKTIKSKKILNKIDLCLNEGDIHGIIGPNGSGKSMLFKSITGLMDIDSGNILINDFDIYKDRVNALKEIGALIEIPLFYDNLTGYQNLVISCILNKVHLNEIKKVINIFKMENYINNKVKIYSLGMKQKLGLARAFLNNPKIIILDEPTNGLDINSVIELKKIIKDLSMNYNISFIITSHNINDIEDICTSFSILSHNTIVKKHDLNDIKSKSLRLIEIYSEDKEKICCLLENDSKVHEIRKNEDKIVIIIDKDYFNQLLQYLIKNNISINKILENTRDLEKYYMDVMEEIKLND